MAISDETRVASGTIPLVAPRASRELTSVVVRRNRRAGRWQLAADLTAAACATTLAVSCWDLYGPRASAGTIAIYAAASLVLLIATTSRTRTASGRVTELLCGFGARIGAVMFDVAIAVLGVGVAVWLGAFGRAAPWLPLAAMAVGALLLFPFCRGVTTAIASPLRVVLIGHGIVAGELRSRLMKANHVELTTIYSDSAQVCADPVRIQHLCERYRADELLVALSDPKEPILPGPALPGIDYRPSPGSPGGPDVEVLLRLSRHLPVHMAIQQNPGATPQLFKIGGAPKVISRAFKRTLDVTVSSLALLLLSPLLLVLLLCVGIDSGFPLLFRQERVGRDGRSFKILKLRTMRPEPVPAGADGSRTPISHLADPMLVTRVGGLLRRTSLDEIPQLINVLRGEMSLVGPRPFVQQECDSLPAWAAARFETRPGMTGMWQVCGQHSVSLDELCWLDIFYVSCWSLAADMRILLLTPARLLRGSV